MKKLNILIGLMVVIIATGVISSGMLDSSLSGLLIVQSADPNASPFVATPVQALQITLWVGFVVANLLVIGLILAGFFWLMNRGLKNVGGSSQTTTSANAGESEK